VPLNGGHLDIAMGMGRRALRMVPSRRQRCARRRSSSRQSAAASSASAAVVTRYAWRSDMLCARASNWIEVAETATKLAAIDDRIWRRHSFPNRTASEASREAAEQLAERPLRADGVLQPNGEVQVVGHEHTRQCRREDDLQLQPQPSGGIIITEWPQALVRPRNELVEHGLRMANSRPAPTPRKVATEGGGN
jgi:hypothetical protein